MSAAASALIISHSITSFELFHNDVEALSKCEITKNDGQIVIFECVGEDGECTLSRWGFTLTCSGGTDVKEKE